jgi:hypothetical protein
VAEIDCAQSSTIGQSEFLLQRSQLGQVEGVSVEMDRDQEANVAARLENFPAGVQVDQAELIGIHENGNRAQLHDRKCGGESG